MWWPLTSVTVLQQQVFKVCPCVISSINLQHTDWSVKTVSVYRLCENPDARSDEASRTAAVGLQPFFAPGFRLLPSLLNLQTVLRVYKYLLMISSIFVFTVNILLRRCRIQTSIRTISEDANQYFWLCDLSSVSVLTEKRHNNHLHHN